MLNIMILNKDKGSVIVRFTPILLKNISFVDTGIDLIIHRLFPSNDIEQALVYTKTMKMVWPQVDRFYITKAWYFK